MSPPLSLPPPVLTSRIQVTTWSSSSSPLPPSRGLSTILQMLPNHSLSHHAQESSSPKVSYQNFEIFSEPWQAIVDPEVDSSFRELCDNSFDTMSGSWTRCGFRWDPTDRGVNKKMKQRLTVRGCVFTSHPLSTRIGGKFDHPTSQQSHDCIVTSSQDLSIQNLASLRLGEFRCRMFTISIARTKHPCRTA